MVLCLLTSCVLVLSVCLPLCRACVVPTDHVCPHTQLNVCVALCLADVCSLSLSVYACVHDVLCCAYASLATEHASLATEHALLT